ncbi:Histidine kinase-like ATPase domain-containing protein [Streptomyces sp. Ag109_G2-15]|nr:Histidine kinase-like ATPase domain-containing protein [Streptomyces sp. Ag109_G2-15]
MPDPTLFAPGLPSLSSCSAPTPPAPPSERRLVHWVTEAAASAVPGGRTSLRRVLERWRIAPELGEALLLAGTELLSNAIRHAGDAAGSPRVTVTLADGWLQLDVADGDPCMPCFGLDVDGEAESGRGLVIVSFLVREVGGELTAFRAGSGKVVRVRVPAV